MNDRGGPHRPCLSIVHRVGAVPLWRRLFTDDSGQDVVEYALLVALVALVSIPGITALQAALHSTYLAWNTAMLRCWQMPAPGAGGGC